VPDAPLRILLVDDHATMRFALRSLLSRDDRFTVVADAGNGKEAVEIAEGADADIVLIDLHLPDVPGESLVPEMRTRLPGATVLLFTGAAESVAARSVERSGADGYLIKGQLTVPFGDQLEQALRRIA
jgi:DNA-binding NarL/FixJ family response regulator